MILQADDFLIAGNLSAISFRRAAVNMPDSFALLPVSFCKNPKTISRSLSVMVPNSIVQKLVFNFDQKCQYH